MSISSHLSPDPERRLWVIHDTVRRAAEWTDLKLGLVGLLAVLELPWLAGFFKEGWPAYTAVGLLCAALALVLAALSPFTALDRQLPLLDQPVGKVRQEDSLVLPEDLARSPYSELVFRMDRYLGGGITAIKIYEDIVARIIAASRSAVRKTRLLSAACGAAILAQLAFAAVLLLRGARPSFF